MVPVSFVSTFNVHRKCTLMVSGPLLLAKIGLGRAPTGGACIGRKSICMVLAVVQV